MALILLKGVQATVEDLTLIRLVAEIISRIHLEASGGSAVNNQSMLKCSHCSKSTSLTNQLYLIPIRLFKFCLIFVVRLVDRVCVDDPIATQSLYAPSIEDFNSLPADVNPPTERIHKIAALVWNVLQEHHDLPVIPTTQEEVLQLVRRAEYYKIPVSRKTHKGLLYNVAYGVYPTFYHFDRYSTPANCRFAFDLNANIEIFASRSILRGEVLTVGTEPFKLMDVDAESLSGSPLDGFEPEFFPNEKLLH